MLDPFAASLLYKSLRLHFSTEKYDFVKFRGKVRGDSIAARNKFLNTNSKHYYAILAKFPEPEQLLVSNFIENPKSFIVDIVSDKGYNVYSKWKARTGALYYNLSQELEVFDNIKDLKKVSDTGLPLLIEKYLEKRISPESVVLIDRCINKLDEWSSLSHPLIQTTLLPLRKYKPFVDYNGQKLQKAMVKAFAFA